MKNAAVMWSYVYHHAIIMLAIIRQLGGADLLRPEGYNDVRVVRG